MRKNTTRVFRWILIFLAGIIFMAFIAAFIIYPPKYVFRVIAWGNSDSFDWQKFPKHPLGAAATSFQFDISPDGRISDLFAELAKVKDWDTFLEENQTQAFIVVKDGTVIYEEYFNDTQRDSIVTSFSVAKSFTSALIGIAIDEGIIKNVNDPITDYLPELAARDDRFPNITIQNLLKCHRDSSMRKTDSRV